MKFSAETVTYQSMEPFIHPLIKRSQRPLAVSFDNVLQECFLFIIKIKSKHVPKMFFSVKHYDTMKIKCLCQFI